MDIFVYQVMIMSYFNGYIVFATTLYLKYKFKEIFDNLKKGIQQKSQLFIFYSIAKHNQLSDFTHHLNCYISCMIGIIFTNGILLCMIKFRILIIDQDINFMTRTSLMTALFLTLSLMYSVNLMTASISTANKSVVKHLYPIFIDKKFNNIWINLKVDLIYSKIE